jgi:hypothetical protein
MSFINAIMSFKNAMHLFPVGPETQRDLHHNTGIALRPSS